MTLSQLLIDVAYAQGAGGKAQPSLTDFIVIPAVMIFVMYFLVLRPQQKKLKEQAAVVQGLKVGDEIVTTGGIIGRVKSIAADFVTVESGANTSLKIQKAHIQGAPKAAPVAGAKLETK